MSATKEAKIIEENRVLPPKKGKVTGLEKTRRAVTLFALSLLIPFTSTSAYANDAGHNKADPTNKETKSNQDVPEDFNPTHFVYLPVTIKPLPIVRGNVRYDEELDKHYVTGISQYEGFMVKVKCPSTLVVVGRWIEDGEAEVPKGTAEICTATITDPSSIPVAELDTETKRALQPALSIKIPYIYQGGIFQGQLVGWQAIINWLPVYTTAYVTEFGVPRNDVVIVAPDGTFSYNPPDNIYEGEIVLEIYGSPSFLFRSEPLDQYQTFPGPTLPPP